MYGDSSKIFLKQAEFSHVDSNFYLFERFYEITTKFLSFDRYEPRSSDIFQTPNTLLAFYFQLSDDKQLYYRRVYSIFDLLEDFGGIAGSLAMIFTPLATYSSILMTNFLLNTHYAYEEKSVKYGPKISTTDDLKKLRQFKYTFWSYICSKCTKNDRFKDLREKGEAKLEDVLNFETLLKYSKLLRVLGKILLKSKFE